MFKLKNFNPFLTVYKLLLRAVGKVSIDKELLSLKGTNSSESPAGSTSSLILHMLNSSLISPVNSIRSSSSRDEHLSVVGDHSLPVSIPCLTLSLSPVEEVVLSHEPCVHSLVVLSIMLVDLSNSPQVVLMSHVLLISREGLVVLCLVSIKFSPLKSSLGAEFPCTGEGHKGQNNEHTHTS